MKWVSSVSHRATFDEAADEVLAGLQRQLAGAAPDLLLAFVSPHHGLHHARLPARLAEAFPGATLVGCSAGGVVGGGEEVEAQAGLSVTAAVLPDVELKAFYLPVELVGEDDIEPEALTKALGVDAAARPVFLLLPEPFSCRCEALLRAFDRACPQATVLGGLASGGRAPGQHALFADDLVVRSGAVGVAMWGDVVVDTVVAQGCRPVGPPLRVTESDAHRIVALDRRPALQVLNEVFSALPDRDRQLFQSMPMVGVAMDTGHHTWRRGDFLVRHVLGVDSDREIVAVGHEMEQGSVIQFHVRDAVASSEDIHELMGRYAREHGTAPEAALIFSCLGRGVELYGTQGHDSRVIDETVGPVPTSGFFGNGEIGPVHGRTFLHGFTSAIGLVRKPAWN